MIVNTFLPHADFSDSAKSLDDKRLGNQRREVLTMLSAIYRVTILGHPPNEVGWFNHPATQMWAFYPHWLAKYGMVICTEVISRGQTDRCLAQMVGHLRNFERDSPWLDRPPAWLGRRLFHESNQRVLAFKDSIHYSEWAPGALAYVWPKLFDGNEVVRYQDVALRWGQGKVDASWAMWEQNTKAKIARETAVSFSRADGVYKDVESASPEANVDKALFLTPISQDQSKSA